MSDLLELIREAIRRMQDSEALLERAEQKVLNGAANAPINKRTSGALAGPPPVALEPFWKSLERRAAELSFDGGESVRLPHTLAELAKVLMSGEGLTQDELAPWKTYPQIVAAMEVTVKRTFTTKAVCTLIWRLRRAFRIAGVKEGLIESARGKGARIRLKKRVGAAVG